MAEDGGGAPLSRRVPGAARPGPGQSAKPVLSDSVLNRMQAAIDAERAQAEPERLRTVPRYEDDPNTEPLPTVTPSGSPGGRRARRGRNPAGAGPETGELPERARKLEAVAEVPPGEEPLRVARALGAAEPESARPVTPEPVRAVAPEPVRAVVPQPEQSRAVTPEPVRAAWPEPEATGAVAPEPVRAVVPESEQSRAVTPEPVRAAWPEPEPAGAAAPEPVRAAWPEPEPAGAVAPEPVRAVRPEPEPVRAAWPEPEPAGAVAPEPVRAVWPEPESAGAVGPVRALRPEPAGAVAPEPVRAVWPEPESAAVGPVRALRPEPEPVRAVWPEPEPEPVPAARPEPVRAVEPDPRIASAPPRPEEWPHPAESVRSPRAAADGPWWAGGASTPEPGPTPGSIGWLWPEDTAARGRGGGGGGGPRWRPPRRWRYRAATLVTLAAGGLVGAGLFIGIALHSTSVAGPVHGNSTPSATARPAASVDPSPAITSTTDPVLAADLTQAAAWISEQVATGTEVACDAQTCAALTASGFPAAQEVLIGLNSQSLSNASVVVMTPELDTFFRTVNPSLGNEVTSAVLASFGQVSVQVIWSGGAVAYQTALTEDVQARIQLGEQLLNSGLLTVSPSAQSEMAAGDVDPRLLLALQSLADSQPIDILGFTDSGPGASPGIPFRAVDLSTTDPNGAMSSSAYLQGVVQILRNHATFPPYQKVSRLSMPDGQTAIQVQYAAPSPLGLLGA